MGKKSKGNNKKGARGDSSDEEDLPPSVVETEESEPVSDRSGSTFDMSESIDMLSEKKFNLREPALHKIITYLRGSHDDEENLRVLDGYLETLTTHLTRMLRRPANYKEGQLCMELVALLGLYMAANAEVLVRGVEKPLLVLCQSKEPNELQAQAVFTLSFIAYVANKEDFMLRSLDAIQTLLLNAAGETLSDEVQSKAADSWVLLASLLPATEVLSKSKDEALFEAFFTQIDEASSTSINSKVSAGKAIAFIYECAKSLHPETDIEHLGYLVCDDSRIVHQALDAIRKISKDSSKKVSKKNRKEQRAEFRDIIDFLEGGEVEEEMLRMQGADVTVRGFGQNTVAEALREVLGSGFHSALVAFPVVREILDVEYLSTDNAVSSTKKVSKSTDKQRTVDRARDRNYRDIHTADFYDSGDF